MPQAWASLRLAIGLDQQRDKGGFRRALRTEGEGAKRKSVTLARIVRLAAPPGQLVVDEVADQKRIPAEPCRRVACHFIRSRGEARVEGIRHRPPPITAGADLGVFALRP